MIDPLSGGAIPKDLNVRLGVQPVDGRLPEKIYEVERDDTGGQLQYKALVPFDREEFVQARVILDDEHRCRAPEFALAEPLDHDAHGLIVVGHAGDR